MKPVETMTDAEVREELAEQGIDLDAEMAKFRPKLDELMRARAVRLALAALKANPLPFASPLLPHGWASMHTENDFFEASCTAVGGRDAIIAAVNAAPVLAAEVERLQGLLAAARVAVELWPVPIHADRCAGWNDQDGDFAGCNCDCAAVDAARTAARRAVGLEG